MNGVTPAMLAGCQIVIIDEVFGTRKELVSPQTIDEALKNQGDVARANLWVQYQEILRPDHEEPIGVSNRKSEDTIIVRWHVTGDLEAARAAMQYVLAGDLWAWL